MEVKPIKYNDTKEWLLNKHYSRSIPSISYAFGLFDEGTLIGIVTFGSPPSSTLCESICGIEYKSNVVELNRLVIESPKSNCASTLIGRAMQMLPKPTIVVSFADTSVNHIGFVYQATNFMYCGSYKGEKKWAVKGMEHYHHKTIWDKLVKIRGGEKVTVEDVMDHYGDKFYWRETTDKHRYIYFHATKKQKKKLFKVFKHKVYDYPKGDLVRYDAGGSVATQGILF